MNAAVSSCGRSFLQLVIVGACLAAGCGDEEEGNSGGGAAPSGPIVLLSDDFSSGTLNNWVVQAPVAQASAFGNPAPSMLLDGLAGGGPRAIVYSNSSFLTNGSLTVAVDVNPGNSNATVDVVNMPNPPTIDTFASITATAVLYSIGGNSRVLNYPNDGLYHRFTFVMGRGVAIWFRDGSVQHSALYAPPMTVRLDLRDLSAGSTGSRFDNVLVTLP